MDKTYNAQTEKALNFFYLITYFAFQLTHQLAYNDQTRVNESSNHRMGCYYYVLIFFIIHVLEECLMNYLLPMLMFTCV